MLRSPTQSMDWDNGNRCTHESLAQQRIENVCKLVDILDRADSISHTGDTS